MKFNKVVYVRYLPLTSTIYKDFYFEELLQNKIKVEYLDVTELFYPERVTTVTLDFEGVIKVKSYKQLELYLKQQLNDEVLYISLMTFESRVFKLHRLFTKFNLNLGVFGRGDFPSDISDVKSKLVRILKIISFSRILLFCANRSTILLKKWSYLKPYDYIFKAGEFGHWRLGMGSEIDFAKAKIVELNTADYDEFLLHREFHLENKNNYIVFLDQYLPYHPDARFLKIKTVEPEKYFKEINSFFDKLEEKTGQKVIIAAHPKADLYKEINPYNNRTIFFNKSNDLVKQASLVLTHASTAVCFPICYEKRLILLVSDYLDIVLPHFILIAKAIANACDATIIAMDKEIETQIPEKINSEKYSDFKYKYLTSVQSENKFSKDIFINFLKSEDKFPK